MELSDEKQVADEILPAVAEGRTEKSFRQTKDKNKEGKATENVAWRRKGIKIKNSRISIEEWIWKGIIATDTCLRLNFSGNVLNAQCGPMVSISKRQNVEHFQVRT